MHGHEFLKVIKTDPKLKHIPVVVFSSSRAKRDVIGSYNNHASGYIVKPLEQEHFKNLVASIEEFFFKVATLPDADDIEQSKRLP